MPKAYITAEARQRARFSAWLYGCMRTCHVTQAELSKTLGVSQPALSKKIKKQQFTFNELVAIFKTFKPDAKEVARLLEIE